VGGSSSGNVGHDHLFIEVKREHWNQMSIDCKEYVLRALAASEIAATCNQPQLQASFISLAEHWLTEAEALTAHEPRKPASRAQAGRAALGIPSGHRASQVGRKTPISYS
jgi:hypothetical protein